MPRVVWLTVILLFAGTVARAAPPPLEAYGRLPAIESVEISPDGQRLAIAVTNGEERRIVVQNIASGRNESVLVAGAAKVRAIQWAGSNHVIVTSSTTAQPVMVMTPLQEWQMSIIYSLDRRTQRPLFSGLDENSMNVDLSLPEVRMVHGKLFVFVEGIHFIDGLGRDSLFRTDPDSAVTTIVNDGSTHTRGYLVGADGALVAEEEYDAHASRWSLQTRQGATWKTVKVLESTLDPPGIWGLGRDGRSILLDAWNDDEQRGLREMDPAQGDWGPVFATAHDPSAIFDAETHALIGVRSLEGDEDRYQWFSPEIGRIWNAARAAYPGQRVRLVSMSADHHKLVLHVDSPTEGPAYALVDIDARKGRWIGGVYDEAARDMSPVTPIAFKAADGMALTGYLTLPQGREAKGLPLIVFPHGGPAARDEPGFDWWAQAMASRGYAVLQVNYRGSDGFGWSHMEAGFGQWGKKMQTDLSDGVRYLAGQGTIDPKRVCIVGASYGGYAALAGAALDTGVYRCAAAVAGISDLRRFVTWGRSRSGVATERYWSRFMGADNGKDPVLEDISPADHVDRVAVPVLLVHGRDDTVVPFEQSQLMADALRKAGKPVDLVTLASEDHWLSRGATRLQMLQAVMTFLERNNPPS